MTEKRFTYIKNALITQYQSIPIQQIGKGKAFHCQGVVDELNKLWNENERLKEENKEIKQLIHRMLIQIDTEKVGAEDARYSARIIFTSKEYKKMHQIWEGDVE